MAKGYPLAKTLRTLVERKIHAKDPRAILSPRDFAWTRALEERHASIRKEAEKILDRIECVMNFDDVLTQQRALVQKEAWKSYFFKALRCDVKAHQESCPVTTQAISNVPGLINAFFSILKPGVHIPTHRGPYAGILRYHMGVIIPEGDLGMLVNGKYCRWQEGESLIFDDSFAHEAWNRTGGTRVILFIDFERPLPPILRFFNRLILRLFERSTAAKTAHQKIMMGQLIIPRG